MLMYSYVFHRIIGNNVFGIETPDGTCDYLQALASILSAFIVD